MTAQKHFNFESEQLTGISGQDSGGAPLVDLTDRNSNKIFLACDTCGGSSRVSDQTVISFNEQPEKPNQIWFVIDMSGSMGNPISPNSSSTKLDVALEAYKTAVNSLEEGTSAGLIIFGPSRLNMQNSSECRKAAVLVPMTAIDVESRQQLLEAPDHYKAFGETPLTYSLMLSEMESDKEHLQGPVKVIGITDGVPSTQCDEAFCVWLPKLIKRKPNWAVDIVGIGMTDKQAKYFNCMGPKFQKADSVSEASGKLLRSLGREKSNHTTNVHGQILDPYELKSPTPQFYYQER